MISNLNNVLLTKLGWKLLKDEANWCKIVKAKYLGNLNFIHCIWRNDLPLGSRIWGNIIKYKILLREGVMCLVGDGIQVHFWEDTWLIDKPLIKMKYGFLCDHLQEQTENKAFNYIGPWRKWKKLELQHNFLDGE